MKKYIFSAMLLGAAMGASLTSCEDMLAPESDLVMYEEDNTLSTANDTLYSVMGVCHLMQKVADRVNLLGEIRADLVSVTDAATTDLKDLANFEVAEGNIYNKPEDYYAIVNNCNYFINTVDPEYKKRGQKVFERELAAMHTFRAWAYLQLAINYGEIPYYTEFIGTEAQAEEILKGKRVGIKEVCRALISDLTPWATVEPLSYSGMSNINMTFIPTRLMLGELCLWAEEYTQAAQWYHDFLSNTSRPHPSYSTFNVANWLTTTKPSVGWGSSYVNSFSDNDELIAYIPFEATPFEGTVSQLGAIYTSDEELNNYYYQVKPSNSAISQSAAQRYYYVYTDEVTHKNDTVSMNDTILEVPYEYGDLRLAGCVRTGTVSSSFSSKYNDNFIDIRKVTTYYQILYRTQVVYLHYAEALNQAGFPSSAFAILKYGLCQDNIERGYVDEREVELAGNLIAFDQYIFTRSQNTAIHDRGCGDSYANPEYVLPEPEQELASYADTVAFWQPFVEQKIVDESMLECAFEGLRYYDLIRTALRHNDATIVANAISKRGMLTGLPDKADEGEQDMALYQKLMDQRNWFLPLK